MSSARLGADAVDACLAAPHRSRVIVRAYERELRRAVRRFSWFIYRFRQPAFRRLFTRDDPPKRIEEAVTTMLSGDVYRRTPTLVGLAAFKSIYYLARLGEALGQARGQVRRQARRITARKDAQACAADSDRERQARPTARPTD